MDRYTITHISHNDPEGAWVSVDDALELESVAAAAAYALTNQKLDALRKAGWTEGHLAPLLALRSKMLSEHSSDRKPK